MAIQLRKTIWSATLPQAALIIFSILAVGPVLLILVNSFKGRLAIFGQPLAFPTTKTFSLAGYSTVFMRGNFPLYFTNSVTVTLVSLLLVVVLGSMAAFALAEYRFRGGRFIRLFLALGIMVPIRLGTVALLELMVSGHVAGTLFGLILVYTAQGLPLTIFVLAEYMATLPDDLKNAARLDGLSELQILFRIVMPLLRPPLAAVSVFTLIPVWNDLWFPLVLAPAEPTKTLTLGAQTFIGQFVTDYGAVLAALVLAMVPVVIIYLLLARQMVHGLTGGAVK